MTTISASSTNGIVLTSPSYTNPVVIDPGVTISHNGDAVFAFSGSWTINNAGSVAGTGANGNGINLVVPGGSVTNAVSASITGGDAGVLLEDGGSVTNAASASITGGAIGVQIGGDGTVVNNGSITGATEWGVLLQAGGSVTNAASASITGYQGVQIQAGPATVLNYGRIEGTGSQTAAVELFPSGGSVTNAASASITGDIAVAVKNGTVLNEGSIGGIGTYGLGIDLYAGGSVTNAASASITGDDSAIISDINPATVVNDGTIAAAREADIYFAAGGVVTNQAGGAIGSPSGDRGAVYIKGGAGTVTNAGTIDVGVWLQTGGAVTNQTGGEIVSSSISSGYGVGLHAGGTVTNAGLISGLFVGIDANHLGGTVTNQAGGTITGHYIGVAMGIPGLRIQDQPIAGGRYVINQAGGTISGDSGVIAGGSSATVTNAGAIAGTFAGTVTADGVTLVVGAGVSMSAGGVVTNQSGGTISGAGYGVYISNGAGAVVNAGTISGSSGAVRFAAGYADRLVVDPGAVFSGTVTGGNTLGATAVSTLELATGASTGTLSGLGTKYIDFGTIVFDLDSDWLIAGNTSGLASTIVGFSQGDTIELTGVTALGSSFANGTLTLDEASGAATLNFAGTFSSGAFQVTNVSGGVEVTTSATISSGVYDSCSLTNSGLVESVTLGAGAVLTNAATGVITNPSGIAVYSAGTSAGVSVINAGRIASTAGNNTRGIELLDGGYVGNAATGTITAINAAGVYIGGVAGTVRNAGLIATSGGTHAPVALLAGGYVSNAVTGTISAVADTNSAAIYVNHGLGTVVNAGRLLGPATDVNFKAGGTVTNQSGGTISTSGYGIYLGGAPGAVVNTGVILSSLTNAIVIKSGGTLSNHLGGTIIGTNGLVASNTPAAVSNAGTITGSSGGVILNAGGFVSNASGGIINGVSVAVHFGGAFGTVVNAGLLTSSIGPGVGVQAGAFVSNQATGTISGGGSAVFIGAGTGTVINAGLITGAAGVVIDTSGGSVANTGTIFGSSDGVFVNAGATVLNAGSIGGGVYAVDFGGGLNNRLIVDPGATFSHTVTGGNAIGAAAVSTLELASSSSAGTLSNVGTQFINFAQITIDAGAAWTLTGANTIIAGATLTELSGAILTDTGTLVNDGAVIVDPSTLLVAGLIGTGSVTIDADSTVTIEGSVSAGETLVFAGTNAVLNLADPAGFAGTIQGQGPTDQVNTPRTLVWTAAQNTDFANAFNWNDLTTPANPASAPPGVLDTAEFLATGGTVTGTGVAAVLQFGSLGLWALGSGAVLTAGTGITVGNGMLAVDGGASIASAGSVDVISGTGGLGASVAVSGADAAWTSAGNLIVGDGGLGALAIEAGGTVASSAGTIANQTGAAGSEVNVTGSGSGSDWQIAGTLAVGNAAEGSLDIASGATVTAASLVAAAQSGGDGVITVAGTGSELAITAGLTLGAQGAGELSILSGATVSALDLTIGGSSALSSGNVDVEGAGSELSIATGGALNIGVAAGGSGVLTIGSDAILNFAGIPTESGHASFNNYGTVDPDGFEYTTASNGNAGLNLYDLYIGNIGAVQVSSGTSTWFTPMVLTGTSVADAANNIGNGDVGEWQLSNDGTLVFNANTVDAGQAIVFEDATDTLVIGQQVDGGQPGVSGETPTVSPGAENLLAAGGFAAELWGYQAGDQILFDNLVVNSDSIVGGNTLELFGAGGTLLGELTFYNKAGTRPLGSSGMAAAAAQLECFAAGTRLLTARGEVAVEAIAVGERVCVLLGDAGDGRVGDGVGGDGLGGDGRAGDGVGGDGFSEVVWVGRREVDCARHPQPRKVWPVRVTAGAFGEGRPHTDLWLSPDHAVYVGEVLIPVKYLINGTTIAQVPVDSITYHHVELAQHDVLLAEGLPVESFLHIKDGRNYPDRAGAVRLYPDHTARMWEAFGCARLVVTGPELDAARALVAGVAGQQQAA